MPLREVSVMEQREAFVRLALLEGANRRELCRRFGISPDTGYRLLARFAADGDLADRSRRPHASPLRSEGLLEAAILAARDAHPAWGARKLAAFVRAGGQEPPAASTIHAILVRHGRIVPARGGARATERFEKEAPNQLWQMDFKGWVKLSDGTKLHALTVIDDHSRYAVCLAACAGETHDAVKAQLTQCFARHGLPEALFVDNGTPWGDASGRNWTRLKVWLLKLGVRVLHSRPFHPQSRGKNERFHRTLKAEVYDLNRMRDLKHAQALFDDWRIVYNHQRPHQALGLDVPAARYRPSQRAMPGTLPEPSYDSDDIVRTVPKSKAYVAFKGILRKVPEAFCGERLAIRPTEKRGTYGVFFASHRVASIDLTKYKAVRHVSEQPSDMSPG
jgi:putative transposase